MKLKFYKKERDDWLPESGKLSVYLRIDNWNDYNFRTLYEIILFDENSKKYDLGYVKIANFGQTELERIEVPQEFEVLDGHFFSLGQSVEYYTIIQNLNPQLKEQLLIGLRDIVYNETLQEKALSEEVTRVSLLRDVSIASIKGQYKRILEDGAILSEYHFIYKTNQTENEAGFELECYVTPESNPPMNIQVLIGRNGVGKTHLLNNMVKTLTRQEDNIGFFDSIPNEFDDIEFFSSVVSVSYSAFDPFTPYYEEETRVESFKYSYIGLKNLDGTLKNSDLLAKEFFESIEHSFHIGKKEKWIKAVESLNSDPLFRAINIIQLSDIPLNEERVLKVFKRLSSGHAIVLLTITKLVETVEEKTLVLLDEPESHLHPPLLSAFIRALSDLLKDRNAVAIIATHSPVIAQEVPKSCVWKLSRFGLEAKAERPEIETFGENIGNLTREIFGLEVEESGFHRLLKEEVEKGYSYEQILDTYDNQLGFEAKLLLRALLNNNDEDLF